MLMADGSMPGAPPQMSFEWLYAIRVEDEINH
jgi:hypothetical protein